MGKLTPESTSEGWHRKSSKIDTLNSTIRNLKELKEQTEEMPSDEPFYTELQSCEMPIKYLTIQKG